MVKHLIFAASKLGGWTGRSCLCILILAHSCFQIYVILYTAIQKLIIGGFILVDFALMDSRAKIK